jgi:hypothetical protein
MLNVLYKYLILNGNVGIPGVGSFTTKKITSQSTGSSFAAPKDIISFESGTALTDKNFYHFLALEKGISDVDAVRKFQDFAYQLRKDLQSNLTIEFSGIGVLKKNNHGEVVLDSTVSTDKYFPVITPVKVSPNTAIEKQTVIQDDKSVIESEDEEIVKQDRWWMWATVLALLAIAAIAFFYWQGNN